MIQIFNTQALTSQQRFTRAIIAGSISRNRDCCCLWRIDAVHTY